jgi:ABC transporter substrate binding protein (PQQ-dependent alcohol dehydrogenase system)
VVRKSRKFKTLERTARLCRGGLRSRLLALAFAALAAWPGLAADPVTTLGILYLSREDDPTYVERREYAGLGAPTPRPPLPGAATAIAESRILGRALKLRFQLEEKALAPGEDAATALAGPGAVVLDLPLDETEALVEAVGRRDDLLLFNIRHPDAALRAGTCAPALYSTFPSRAMLADAMAQFLATRGWGRVLLLAGPDPASRADADAFEAAAAKFGLTIAERRPFELTNDPRKRDLSNVALLTGGVDYDVVYVADAPGEFARFVPYATYSPRPVVGSAGLRALAWHWTLERSGAPQLNQRFSRQDAGDMTPADWAAWAAVRSVVEAVTKTGSTDIADLRAYLATPDFALDLYKGLPGSYRPWDGQLRQQIVLADSDATVAVAPLPQFLHERNVLDTLGADARESGCPGR